MRQLRRRLPGKKLIIGYPPGQMINDHSCQLFADDEPRQNSQSQHIPIQPRVCRDHVVDAEVLSHSLAARIAELSG